MKLHRLIMPFPPLIIPAPPARFTLVLAWSLFALGAFCLVGAIGDAVLPH